MKKYFILSLIVLGFSNLSASAGIIDVRFADGHLTSPQTYCVDVQVKAQGVPFELGSATIFFSYNPAAIKSPTYTALNFNEVNACALNGAIAPYKNSMNSREENGIGEANYAIILNINNQGCPTVTNDWIDVASFCFEVVDGNANTQLELSSKYTAFNTVANTGEMHTLGNLSNLSNAVTSTESPTSNSLAIFVLPTITKNTVTADVFMPQTGIVKFRVIDLLGKQLMAFSKDAIQGRMQQEIDLSRFENGYYLVEIDNGQSKHAEKILLMR